MIACGKELIKLESKENFRLVDYNDNIDINILLPLMWVFKYKIDSNDYLTKFKSRLVVSGHL